MIDYGVGLINCGYFVDVRQVHTDGRVVRGTVRPRGSGRGMRISIQYVKVRSLIIPKRSQKPFGDVDEELVETPGSSKLTNKI